MLNRIRKFFAPPILEDEEATRRASWLNAIILFLIVLRLIIILAPTTNDFLTRATSIENIRPLLLAVIAFILNKRGYIGIAATIILVDSLIESSIYFLGQGGLRSPFLTAFAFLLCVAALIVGERGAMHFTSLLVVVLIGFAVAENYGFVTSDRLQNTSTFSLLFGQIVVLVPTGFVIWLTTRSLRQSLKNAQQKEAEVRTLASNLEKRVEERTVDLETANQRNEKRARQFEAIAQVASVSSAGESLNEALLQLTFVISKQFGFYHAGIFLLDESKKYAILKSANSEGGKRMLERGHRLEVGETGLVGFVAATGRPRIALDTGADAVHFNNPDLPETKSEVALPLLQGKEVIGVLDVQSIESQAFTTEDIETLSILASQVSIIIQNTQLYEENAVALQNAEKAYRQLTGETWKEMLKAQALKGYVYDGIRSEPLKRTLQLENPVSIPVNVRGQNIGALKLEALDNDREWSEDEIAMLTAAAERAALALEGARLLAESQKRAAKERTIGEITSKISAQSEVDELLKTAARELSRTLPGTEIAIQFNRESTE
ncbi:MAG: GAF domain-containing protein [Anaerolineales bacterium]|nr:GAF domain-containing protein [Anaerolineales bacterium]